MICFAFLFAGAMLVIGVVAGFTITVWGMNKLLDQDKQLQFGKKTLVVKDDEPPF